MILPKDAGELLNYLFNVGILDEHLEPSAELHRAWRRLQIAVEKNPMAVKKAQLDGIRIQDSTLIPAIISFFPEGLDEHDVEIIYNAVNERLAAIPAIPYQS